MEPIRASNIIIINLLKKTSLANAICQLLGSDIIIDGTSCYRDEPCSCSNRIYGCEICGCRCCGCSCVGCVACLRNMEKTTPTGKMAIYYEASKILESARDVLVPKSIQRMNISSFDGCNCANGSYSCRFCHKRGCGPECALGNPGCLLCPDYQSSYSNTTKILPSFFGEPIVDADFEDVYLSKIKINLKNLNEIVKIINDAMEELGLS